VSLSAPVSARTSDHTNYTPPPNPPLPQPAVTPAKESPVPALPLQGMGVDMGAQAAAAERVEDGGVSGVNGLNGGGGGFEALFPDPLESARSSTSGHSVNTNSLSGGAANTGALRGSGVPGASLNATGATSATMPPPPPVMGMGAMSATGASGKATAAVAGAGAMPPPPPMSSLSLSRNGSHSSLASSTAHSKRDAPLDESLFCSSSSVVAAPAGDAAAGGGDAGGGDAGWTAF